RWQGVIFSTTSRDRVYPQVGLSSLDKTQDAFVSVQKKNVLITRKNGYATQPTLVYFPSTLDALSEQNGWLFVKEGAAYLAVRPAGGTYNWLTSAKNKAANIADRFISLNDPTSPIIFQTGRAASYASFAAFENDVMNNTRSYVSGTLTYTGSDGTTFTM